MNEIWFVLGFLSACTLFLYAYISRPYRRRNDYILRCQILTYNIKQKEDYESLGVDKDPDENWAPFIIDLRSVIAIKPPAEGDVFTLLMNQSVIYTSWNSFVIDVPYKQLVEKWEKIKLRQ